MARKERLERLDLSAETRRADDYIAELESSRDLTQIVVHVDCDAFFAAVEELDRPELKEKPMAVGKGVLTTCNYVARKYGCRSGMASFVAKKLCPELIVIPQNTHKYTAKAREIRAILAEYDPCFESASIDEAYLNITAYCEENRMDPQEAVQQMRARILAETKISVSAGIAPNAKLAKVASNKNKPNGQYYIPNDRESVMNFMKDLPVRKINGIGRVFERQLNSIGIHTCGDIYPQRAYLSHLFGDKAYRFLIQCYLGLGRTKVQPAEEHERKSVGTESTFGEMSDPDAIRAKLRWTAEELEKDLARAQVKGRTLVLKVKLHTFEVLTRQTVPPKAVHLAQDLYTYALPMLAKLEKEIPNFRLRLLGLRCTHLVSTKKVGLAEFFGITTRKASSSPTSVEDSGAANIQPNNDNGSSEFNEQPVPDMSPKLTEDDGDQNHQSTANDNPLQDSHEPTKPNFWDCPICNRRQAADDRTFNAHVDSCLSRQAIFDVLRESGEDSNHPNTNESRSAHRKASSSSPVVAMARKRKFGAKGTPEDNDPRQKKLFFI